jgi:hypothetical protein
VALGEFEYCNSSLPLKGMEKKNDGMKKKRERERE